MADPEREDEKDVMPDFANDSVAADPMAANAPAF